MKPVVLKESKKAEYNPDHNRLTLQILFPKANGGKATGGRIVLINGDVPQVLIDAPKPIEVTVEAHREDGQR